MFIYKESADDLWRHWLPKREFVIDMTEYVSDPDGEQLKYTVTVSNPTVAGAQSLPFVAAESDAASLGKAGLVIY